MLPLIHTCCTMQSVKAHMVSQQIRSVPLPNNPPSIKEYLEEKGCVLIQDLQHKVMYITYNMRFMNNYTYSFLHSSSKNFLQVAENEKKKKYLEVCIQKWRNFYPFFDLSIASIPRRPRLVWSVFRVATQKNGGSRTLLSVSMSKIVVQSRWYRQLTATIRDS